MPTILKSTERRELTGPVLIPDVVDHHGDTYTEEEVYKACRNFRDSAQTANLQHEVQVSKSSAEFTELYTTPAEMQFGEDTLPKGTWMATVRVCKDLWSAVQDGLFTGFSIGGLAKVQTLKGKTLGETGLVARKRLSDFDFSSEDAHIALVDEAANATEFLVMKAKVSGKPAQQPKQPEPINKKESLMTDVEKEALIAKAIEQREVEVQKAKEAEMKAAAEAEMMEELETLRKAKEEADEAKVELEELRKAKLDAEKEKFAMKAKELKVEELEEFLYKAKDIEGFASLEDVLKKFANATGIPSDIGEGSTGDEVVKSMEEKIQDITKSVQKEDDSLSIHQARTKAVAKFKRENPEEYAMALRGE